MTYNSGQETPATHTAPRCVREPASVPVQLVEGAWGLVVRPDLPMPDAVIFYIHSNLLLSCLLSGAFILNIWGLILVWATLRSWESYGFTEESGDRKTHDSGLVSRQPQFIIQYPQGSLKFVSDEPNMHVAIMTFKCLTFKEYASPTELLPVRRTYRPIVESPEAGQIPQYQQPRPQNLG
ncbi:predicted protein [Aspergillus nidulans FGSC A4]|uniref:Uncharacterized protein n=1 Tax=Emericella nidulans (strain FGSC A4 / ATCC 38163 / CBS 112.46 / NRRL 194 / M139) TaxID=227321 RepID=Q5ARV4_EMENI|nr:hypothetical protein [Aspergillus nidulans FGSC A4]EAA64308.1 predicted protein [Aspergillus nidulans FGSC A4]CBF84533.1 TPA: conserved hypothetical protein [Aspergillus nidulans FGSC A4]|eukprot:XP_682245.1 predicted protein [Aspergillus nidulans FGSC A4]